MRSTSQSLSSFVEVNLVLWRVRCYISLTHSEGSRERNKMLLFTLTSAYGKAEGTKFNYMIEQAMFAAAFGCSIYQVAKITDTPITEIKSRFTGEFIHAFGDVIRRLNTILMEALSVADTDYINLEALIDNAYALTKARLNATLTANNYAILPILLDANQQPLWGYDKEESND